VRTTRTTSAGGRLLLRRCAEREVWRRRPPQTRDAPEATSKTASFLSIDWTTQQRIQLHRCSGSPSERDLPRAPDSASLESDRAALAGGPITLPSCSVPLSSHEAAESNEANQRNDDAQQEAPDQRHDDAYDHEDSAEAEAADEPPRLPRSTAMVPPFVEERLLSHLSTNRPPP
jgi:hypothetical protein